MDQRHIGIYPLDATFPEKWIGRGGSVAWTERSPDLTFMDFFFCGYRKNQVYRSCHLLARFEQKNSIVRSVEGIIPKMCGNTFKTFEYRMDVMRATKRAQAEVQ
jgi:hypothetical protein